MRRFGTFLKSLTFLVSKIAFIASAVAAMTLSPSDMR